MMSNEAMSPQDKLRRLALEHPDWLPVADAATRVAERVEAHGGEFAGTWVLSELDGRWVPNLRILVAYDLLEKSGPSTRGGRRAYYRMPDWREIRAGLAEWGSGSRPPTRRLSFIGAGSSGGGDTGRRAGDIGFDPTPWR